MNKQPTTIRAYLLRGAFLLSLAFVIVMPLALGQTRSRGSKPSVAAAQMPQVAPPSTGAVSSRPGSQLPTSGPTGVRSLRILPQPAPTGIGKDAASRVTVLLRPGETPAVVTD